MTTIITPELLKSAPFLWDTEKQKPPPERCVCIDAARPALWGNAILAASAALRCGSRVSVIATGHELGALALALPESTFLAEVPDSGAVSCFPTTPDSPPSQGAVIVTDGSAALPENCMGITSQSLENISSKSTFAGGWPQLKVLLPGGETYEPEARQPKDGPQPFVAGGEFALAGIAAALLARGLSQNAAAVWGLYLFHLTIEAAAKDLGSESVRASDLIARLPGSLRYATRRAEAGAAVRSGLRPV
jgi:hypothetical protein